MKENLKVGTMIDGSQNQTNNGIIEKYCYDNDPANCDVYGSLYKWNEMMQYSTNSGVQGICMTGWHLPTNEEWTTLSTYLGGESVAGGKMKTTGTIEEGTGLWYSPNAGATNSSGFSGLPGGVCYSGSCGFQGLGAFFWSSSQFTYNSPDAWSRNLAYSYSDLFRRYDTNKSYGYSVRCLKDN
jgi:uncharacterized protein (TIGR02145 family)